MSSACVCHIHGEYCFYCEMYLPLESENERLKAENARYRSALELMDTRKQPFYPRSQLAKWAIATLDGEEVSVNATHED